VGLNLGWQCGISVSIGVPKRVLQNFLLTGIILIAGDKLLHFFLSKQISMMTDINSQSRVVEKEENISSSRRLCQMEELTHGRWINVTFVPLPSRYSNERRSSTKEVCSRSAE
jgi:hypothetical protein